jgi:high-affinity nickel permease
MSGFAGILTIFLLGMRHGIDHDHIAAISDLAGLGATARRAMLLGVLYAAGHAIVLFLFGGIAVGIGLHLPEGVEAWRERIVGLTLMLLGGLVLWQLIRHRNAEHPVASRGMLLMRVIERLLRFGRGEVRSFSGGTAAFIIGMIHGVGAETPSQILVLVLAAGVGGSAAYWCVAIFVGGLFVSNTIMCGAAVGLFARLGARRTLFRYLSGAAAAYSVVVGIFFLFGWSAALPAI